MSTTSILLPPHPPTPIENASIEATNQLEETIKQPPFYKGEMVLMRSSRISKEEVYRFYKLYGSTLPVNVWWSYLGKDYNSQIEYCKDSEDDGGYYMFHTKYIGAVKEQLKPNKNKQQALPFDNPLYIVEWSAREDSLMPGENYHRISDHYPENLLSMSKMTILTKEEILEDTLKWAIENNKYVGASALTTK